MARILVSGYYGFGNAGDEAILDALAAGLPEHRLTVLSGDPAATRAEHGLEAIPRQSLRHVLAAVRAADLVVSGGGSLLQDATGPRSIPYYLGILWLARLMRRPFVVYAQGVGPVRSPLRFRMLRLLDHAQAITVRDQASAALLRKAGIRRPPLEVTADAALALPRPQRDPDRSALRRLDLPGKAPVFALSVRRWQGDGFVAAVAAAADGMLRRFGGSVVLVPMQFPEDVAACEVVRARMREPAAVLSRRLPTAQLLELFACFDLVVGMRLHALIFAVLAGAAPVGLSYDPKVDAFLHAIGAPAPLAVRGLRGEDLLAALADWLPAAGAGASGREAPLRDLQTLARRNNEVVRASAGLSSPHR
jgi:polysaccharide pyruvyl transferase CsaB